MKRLTRKEIDSYRKRGWLVQRQVLEAREIAPLIEESRRLWKETDVIRSKSRVQGRKTIRGGYTTDRIDPVLDISSAYTRLSKDLRFTERVSDLLDDEPPQILKAKLICKWPGTAGYSIHQDYPYWRNLTQAGPDEIVSLMLALDPCTADSGAVEFFPGYHDRQLGAPAQNPNDVDEREVDLTLGELATLAPGDIALFHGLIPHRSGPNHAQHNRKLLFFTYLPSRYANDAARHSKERADDAR